MAKDSDRLAGTFGTENTGGVLSGLLAEENEFDRRALWRIGSWGAAAVAAVVVAVMANQASLGMRRDQLAAADLTQQAQQLQALTRESQNEARRLASAIDTLNSDRDRLYSRVTVLEQGLDSVTGAIARQNSATAATPAAASKPPEAPPPSQTQAAAPAVASVATTAAPVTTSAAPATTTIAPVATTVLAKSDPAPKMDRSRPEAKSIEQSPPITSPAPAAQPAASTAPAATPPTPATPLMAVKSILAPPDPGAAKLIEPERPVVAKAEDLAPPDAAASAAPMPDASDAASPKAAVQRTEFAVDVGSANSVGGLRALWRGLTKSNPELAALRPIIMVKESATGLGMQLRLAAGPLTDAAAAAKICASLIESQRACDTTVFDGQRLAMRADDQAPPVVKPVPPQQHRHNYYPKRAKKDDPPAKPEPSTLSRWFGREPSKP